MNTRYEHAKEYTITGPKIGCTRLRKIDDRFYKDIESKPSYQRYFNKLTRALQSHGYPEGFRDVGVEIVAGFLWTTYEFYYLNAENELCGEYEGRLILWGGEEENRIIEEVTNKREEESIQACIDGWEGD